MYLSIKTKNTNKRINPMRPSSSSPQWTHPPHHQYVFVVTCQLWTASGYISVYTDGYISVYLWREGFHVTYSFDFYARRPDILVAKNGSRR